MKAVLVYQGGIANVFEVDRIVSGPDGRNARRLYQGDFGGAEHFSRGMIAAGATVRTMVCNQAGDAANLDWSHDLEDAPFADRLRNIQAN